MRRRVVLLLILLNAILAVPSNAAVIHPCLTIKPADIARARENVARYPWAKEYAAKLNHDAAIDAEKFTPAFVVRMLEATTPLSTEFTPCPACRAAGKTWHPHGQWAWSVDDPDKIKCEICGTVFPTEKYPESIVLHSQWSLNSGGSPQTFSFVGGEPFVVFGYKTGRPSLSGCIRAHKVDYMTTQCNLLAEAYLLSGDVKFARALRIILLRLAEVYPHWLVHSGYGEFADMDPHVAAAKLNALPADELVYTPNKPDRVLFTGYWSAGRATGHGLEGWFVRLMAFAYDAACTAQDEAGKAIFSNAERMHIEKDLLLESTYLLTADKAINNKSVANRAAAAMVGMTTGEPSLVHFGVEGFHKTVDDWFLPDGGTPESAAYALMVFNGTHALPLAMRGYSDPVGYKDADDGTRIDGIDLFHGMVNGKSDGKNAYAKAWGAMVDGLQGDLTLPPYADTRAGSKFPSQWADLLVAEYPERPQYLALLKELCGDDLKEATAQFAIWYREPGLEKKITPRFSLPDFCLPEQRIGQMRTGETGRESLLILNASHWGAHHHWDSLGLYYWKDGHELLSDLGYLWDNPLKHNSARTVAHNTVVIDEQDQRDKERGGDVQFFVTSPHVKAMRASSNAYSQASRYERTSVLVDHGNGHSYVADFFTVQGGKTRDYIFHGPSQQFAITAAKVHPINMSLYDFTNVRAVIVDASDTWRMDWTMDDKTVFSAWSTLTQENDFIADGWGQRDPFNKDAGATLPYIVRRCSGEGPDYFEALYESHPRKEGGFISSVTHWRDHDRVGLQIVTSDGGDYIHCTPTGISVRAEVGNTIAWEFSNDKANVK